MEEGKNTVRREVGQRKRKLATKYSGVMQAPSSSNMSGGEKKKKTLTFIISNSNYESILVVDFICCYTYFEEL